MYTIAKPLSIKSIKEASTILRDYAGVNDTPYLQVLHFMENIICRFDSEFDYEIKPVASMPNEYGLTRLNESKIILREDVYDRAAQGVARDRFTVAHEIGHYLLHSDGRVGLARNSKKPKPYQDPEWQSNTFAAYFLAPEHIIRGMNAAQVAKVCGVSMQVANIQLKKIS